MHIDMGNKMYSIRLAEKLEDDLKLKVFLLDRVILLKVRSSNALDDLYTKLCLKGNISVRDRGITTVEGFLLEDGSKGSNTSPYITDSDLSNMVSEETRETLAEKVLTNFPASLVELNRGDRVTLALRLVCTALGLSTSGEAGDCALALLIDSPKCIIQKSDTIFSALDYALTLIQ